jgi:glucosyl-3-phosphoglycerate synthase
VTRPDERPDRFQRRYLETVLELAGDEAGSAVSFHEVLDRLSCTEAEANAWCDFWTSRDALVWPARGHIALTAVGISYLAEALEDGHHPDELGTASVSVVIPALNEGKTIGRLVEMARRSPRVLETLVVDDGSTDDTAEVASRAGAHVMMSTLLGKGASMADGIGAAQGEIILFLDGDLREIRSDFVERMTDPILAGEADLVKAKFSRDTGRVTTLTARPLISAFFPELAHFDQPLGGIVAVRQAVLSSLRLENDYGVDVGLLIDAVARGAIAVEVDIGRIDHDSQSLEALGQMAKHVTRVILDRAWRHERLSINQVLGMQEMERRARADLLPAVVPPDDTQKFALFDMDGVIVDGRYAVELAERVGAESELSLLLDNQFIPDAERTRAIAALFSGVHWDVFEETACEIPLTHGAVETVVALRAAGYRVGLVSDSFHVAAETIRRRVFADFCVAHVMHFHNRVATGEVTPSPLMTDSEGCPRHAVCKSNVIRKLRASAGLVPEQTLAVGDGSNDICMLQSAGISVAFRPKSPLVEEVASHVVTHSLLDILDLPGVDVDRALTRTGTILARGNQLG